VNVVPRVKTPLTRPELRTALVNGYRLAFEAEPTEETIGVAWAQLCEESGNGQWIWNNNFGNVDALPDWQSSVFELTAREVINGRSVMRTKRLCAFPNPEAGAAHYWRRLSENYADALPFFEAGDPVGAAKKLKELRYYTGDVEAYADSMRLLYRDYERAFGGP
jgi:flagellum-specific peptidoglycan hydrolase FlgJ